MTLVGILGDENFMVFESERTGARDWSGDVAYVALSSE